MTMSPWIPPPCATAQARTAQIGRSHRRRPDPVLLYSKAQGLTWTFLFRKRRQYYVAAAWDIDAAASRMERIGRQIFLMVR